MRHGNWLLAALVGLLAAGCCAALESDQILLLVNANVPQGRALAEVYREARNLPADRILELRLPPGDEIGFTAYENNLVPAVRQYLREKNLERKIACIVTFYGVPLRIVPGQRDAAERQELVTVQEQLSTLSAQLKRTVEELESAAKTADPGFVPLAGDDTDRLAVRAEAVLGQMGRRLLAMPDGPDKAQRTNDLVSAIRQLNGPAGALHILAQTGATRPAAGDGPADGARQALATLLAEATKLQERREDPEARAALRKLTIQNLGLVFATRVLKMQADYLTPANALASLDSELALLWWTYYQRQGMHVNPLHFQTPAAVRASARPVLMISRLDAPQAGQVREMILTSVRVEKEGLKGRVVLDSRGITDKQQLQKRGSYAWYDQTIRNTAELIRTRTRLPLLHEDSGQLLQEGAADGVAVYCGWYSVRKYVPCCRFAPGAVAFHVASYELVSLHGEQETGWVRGLLNDGAVASFGSVAEPYLGAFPPADEFLPLLFTGKLTLAEAYWNTTPTTSWMLTLVGDPLYNPFRNNPALRVEDLPQRLARAVGSSPATGPAQ